jgi:hypothetical protein
MMRKIAMCLALCASWQAYGRTAAAPYPKMAPLEAYLSERDAEISLARSAAPDSISHDAEVWVLGRHGYEVAVKGTNGFVCAVERSWTAGPDDPDFWNPKLRGPICFNAPAARTYWPIMLKRTELILAGVPREQAIARVSSSLDKKELAAPEPGSMCYMLSPHQYLGDSAKRWHPHLMFFVPQTADIAWGAGLPGSPVLVGQEPEDRLTVFMVPVAKWSDGTADIPTAEPHKH